MDDIIIGNHIQNTCDDAQLPIVNPELSSTESGSGGELQLFESSPMPQLEDFLSIFETTYRQDQTDLQPHSHEYQGFRLNGEQATETEKHFLSAFSPTNFPGLAFDMDISTLPDDNFSKEFLNEVSTVRSSVGDQAIDQSTAIVLGNDASAREMSQASISLPKELTNTPSALCGYFFKEVITLYCAWDSRSNHMRFLLEKLWQSSAPLYHTILSMAAACLADDFPHLSSIAAKEHSNALAYLRNDSGSIGTTEDQLLSLMLLGQTASWHSPEDLAIERFKKLQTALDTWYRGSRHDATSSFFSDAMNYWAMLLAFLTDSGDLSEDGVEVVVRPESLPSCSLPHPICGTAREIARTLASLGALIFRFRKRMSTMNFMSEKDVRYFQESFDKAEKLERTLLEYVPTDPGMVLDPGDPRTPLLHFHHINEAYRCTGLLQLYRVFPDLLTRRYRPWNKEELLKPQPAVGIPSEEQRNLWLTKLAMHILGHLREIPFESRTRSVQPFIFVAVSSELRLNPGGAVANVEGDVSHFFIEVARARKFVSSRLSAYMHILPLRKVRVIFELVTSMWAEIDAGRPSVYWVDVAFQKRLGTLMG